jgi:hypothetical protein
METTIQKPFSVTVDYIDSPAFKEEFKASKYGTLVKPYVRLRKKGDGHAKLLFALSRLLSDKSRILIEIDGDEKSTTLKHKHRSQWLFTVFIIIGLIAFVIPGLLVMLLYALRRKARTKFATMLFEFLEDWAR